MRQPDQHFYLYFGDMSTSHEKYSLRGKSQKELLTLAPFNLVPGQNVIFLDQTHSARGYYADIPVQAEIAPYGYQGDYSITTLAGVALVIETADCVPVVLVDKKRGCIAAVHAGWRGTLEGIIMNALQDMLVRGCNLASIEVFIGPAARGCCYEVTDDFKNMFRDRRAFRRSGQGTLSFDIVDHVTAQLTQLGVAEEHISTQKSLCTICCLDYCSYRRRQGNSNLRQMTIVALK
jgi:YfiH family protein